KPPFAFGSDSPMAEGYAPPRRVSMTLAVRRDCRFGLGGGLLGLAAAVDPLIRHVLEGLELLLVVLAADEAFLDVALDRTAGEEARIPDVLVTGHGGFS